jgi:V8-like Glu-specific endopeptidase
MKLQTMPTGIVTPSAKKFPFVLTGLSLAMAMTIGMASAGESVSITIGENIMQVSPAPSASSVDAVSIENPKSSSEAEKFWTPDKYKNAKPLPLPKATQDQSYGEMLDSEEMAPLNSEPSVEEAGHAPTVDVSPDLKNRLFKPDRTEGEKKAPPEQQMEVDSLIQQAESEEISPMDSGTKGAYFSSSQLTPLSADLAYPYRAVGKLFFTMPGGRQTHCSAAVIKPRLILTAGHCVHTGNGNASGWHFNFRFVPAFRSGSAPYQSWGWKSAQVTGDWFYGQAKIPNAADYALIELEDRNANGVFRRIGEITGWLSVKTNALLPNHAHLLGYPENFDNGQVLHQVTAQSYGLAGNNNVFYGSDMEGGSSGGPWVMNFGAPSVGQAGGLQPQRNQVIGVTSWGYPKTLLKVQASSSLDYRFIDILNKACGRQYGNC